ncbi:serine/arginine repetitive matrix protein 1 [Nematostella vectensis]|uniref:serine/arginine repetitive matrix protein 1 n=1 Tax=Nematostella vectensis TaxID=45351 RepID=UPI0020776919|nr:serine/arginine repetitive matrix protein 1 [Nematostella vectensis]
MQVRADHQNNNNNNNNDAEEVDREAATRSPSPNEQQVVSDVQNSEQVVYNLRRGRTIRPFPTNQRRRRQLRRQPSPIRIRVPTTQSTEERRQNLMQRSLLQRRGHPPLPRLRLRLTPPPPPSRLIPLPQDATTQPSGPQQGPETQEPTQEPTNRSEPT